MQRKLQLALAALAAVASLAAVSAGPAAAVSNPVIADCVAHGALSKPYTVQQLHQALGALSAATKEYTNCLDVINRALAGGAAGKNSGGTGGSGSSSFLPTPVIIILVVLILAAVTFGAVAIRRRRQTGA